MPVLKITDHQMIPLLFESRTFSPESNLAYCGCRVPHLPNNNPANPSHRPGWIYLFELLDLSGPAGQKIFKVGKHEAENLDERSFIKKLKRRNTLYYKQTYGHRFRIVHLIAVACAEGGEKQATRLWRHQRQRNAAGNHCENMCYPPLT